MIAGHFGLAAMAKSRAQAMPLWALMLATVWLDVVFVPLYLAHIETLQPVPGAPPGYGGNIIHAVYTHSLVGAVLLSAFLGLAAAALWGRVGGLVIGLMSFSHWLLDLVVHRPDLPLFPGNWGGYPELGFGLWQYRDVSIAVEALLVLLGAWLYGRAAFAVTQEHKRGWAILSTATIALFGGLVLFLDVTGIAG